MNVPSSSAGWARRTIPKLTTAEALATHCPKCRARPSEPCNYVASVNLLHPYSTSSHVLMLRAQIGSPTRRPHNARYDHPARRLRQWLAEHAPILWESTCSTPPAGPTPSSSASPASPPPPSSSLSSGAEE